MAILKAEDKAEEQMNLTDEELWHKYKFNDDGVFRVSKDKFLEAIAEARKGMWKDEDLDEYYDFVQLRWDGKGVPLTAFKQYRKKHGNG